MQLFFSLARIIGLFVTYIGQWQNAPVKRKLLERLVLFIGYYYYY